MSLRRRRIAASLLLAASGACQLALPQFAGAATFTWANTDVSFSDGNNWLGGAAPTNSTNTDVGLFLGTPTAQPQMTAARSIGALDIQSAGWIFGGTSALTVGSISGSLSGINSTAGTPTGALTFNCPLIVGSNDAWNTTLDTTVNGLFSTGGGTSTERTITLNSTGSTTFAGGVSINGTGTVNRDLRFDGTGNLTINSLVTDNSPTNTGFIRWRSTGVLTLSGASNTYVGGLQLDGAGVIAFDRDTSFGAVPATTTPNAINVTNSGTLKALASTTLAATRGIQITAGKTLTIDTQANDLQIDGPIIETGSAARITKQGTGLLTLTNNNTFTGSVTLSAGGIAVGSDSALGTGTIKFSGGSISAVGAAHTLSNTINLGATFDIVGDQNLTFAGQTFYNDTGTSSRTIHVFSSGVTTFNGIKLTPAQGATGGDRSLTFSNPTAVTAGDLRLVGPITDGVGSNDGSGYVGSLAFTRVGKTFVLGTNTYTGSTTVTNGAVEFAASAQTPLLNNTAGTDIQGGRILFDYTGASPAATLAGLLLTSYANNGFNNTTDQIHSTTASAIQGLALSDDGTSAVTIAYTFYGDADLDGQVATSDFTLLSQHFNQSVTKGLGWTSGDFNYDGVVNALDFNLLAINFGQPLPPPPVLGALVPEPVAAASMLVLSAAALSRRRRSRA